MDTILCTLGKYEIYQSMYRCFPTVHNVINLETNETHLMKGDAIYIMLKEEGLSHPTFNRYAEYVRKRDHPTEEEIAAKIRQQEKQLEWEQKRKQEHDEKYYKSSSSYIERLKEKHTSL